MKTRTKIGLAVVGAASVAAVATAFAFGGHGHGPWHGHHRPAMMQRFIGAMIDDALDHAGGVTPEQRAAVHAARDRVLAAVGQDHGKRAARRDEVLRLFEAETLDQARVAALRQEMEAEHRRMADAVGQALADVHKVLTPAQRKAVAQYVRDHRPGPRWGGRGDGPGRGPGDGPERGPRG